MTARLSSCVHLKHSTHCHLMCFVLICTTSALMRGESASASLVLNPSVANFLQSSPATNSINNIRLNNQQQAAGMLNNAEIENFQPNPTGSELTKDGPIMLATTNNDQLSLDTGNCQLIPIVHLLKHPGCQLKAISSFACAGSCPSYVQTSPSKFWQHERSCSCCQQTGSQEATFTLDCPSLDPPFKKVKTYAPVDCMCRSCTTLGRDELRPQELVEALAGDQLPQTKSIT